MGFLDVTSKVEATKEIDKLNFIKIFKFCASNYIIKKEPQNERNLHYASSETLICRI